jgi:CRP-like cAMP-binding protein/mannose-6-phosphate isomerase-like protein (cupin superfamily)
MPPPNLGGRSGPPFIPDSATIKKSLATHPVSIYEAGEMVIATGETTGKLLLLRQGSVEVVKEGTQIARISEPGAVFGELAALLDQPHAADVRALEQSEFSVADAAMLLASDPTAALYVAAILADRLDAANSALVEVKHQLETGKPRATVARTAERIAGSASNVEGTVAGAASPGDGDVTARNKKGVGDGPPPKRRSRFGASFIPDAAAIQKSLAMLPVSTFEPGEMVIASGETTGKLLLLRQGLVEVSKEGTQIARISEPGAVFGELAALLDQPHTADVRALERSEFSVANAAMLLASDSTAALYVAAILAGRLDAANVALVEVKRQLEAGEPRVAVARTLDKIAELLTNESFAEDVFLDELIPKPWGREYRIYADNFYDVWKLELGPGRGTSLHYHPRKDTVLMCLGGHGRIQLADKEIDVFAGSHIFIGRGVFHATTNVGEGELELIEVEHPRNKFDLVRVQDSYGRASQPYESTAATSKNLPELVEYDGIPGAKYRPTDIYGRYRFTIGKTVGDRDGDQLMLAVPVGPHSPAHAIEVFSHGSLEGMRLNETEHCFTITVSI